MPNFELITKSQGQKCGRGEERLVNRRQLELKLTNLIIEKKNRLRSIWPTNVCICNKVKFWPKNLFILTKLVLLFLSLHNDLLYM
jgi:hypothetical protein